MMSQEVEKKYHFSKQQKHSLPNRLQQRRKHDANLARLSSTEVVELEQSIDNSSLEEMIKPFVPFLAWATWILIGALFYGFYDKLPWYQALYMSVNIGWSMGWVMDWEYEMTPINSLFSTLHTSIGVVFIGTAVIYIAKEVGKNKDNWILQLMKKQDLDLAAQTEGYMDDIIAFFTFYLPKLKIFILFLVWFAAGMIWYAITLPSSTNGWELLDFVLSVLSGGGYLAIKVNSNRSQYVVTSLYTTIGVPLMSIALGLVLSLLMEAPEDRNTFDKIVAGVTSEEIEFMKMFEIDDGDGTVDSKEFIILTVVRIGAAPPTLINTIHARFDMLDRQHTGRIKYDDIVFGRKKRPQRKSFGNSVSSLLRSWSSKDSLPILDDDDSKNAETATSKTSPISDTQLVKLNSSLKRTNTIGRYNKKKRKDNKVGDEYISMNNSSPSADGTQCPLINDNIVSDLENGNLGKSTSSVEEFSNLGFGKLITDRENVESKSDVSDASPYSKVDQSINFIRQAIRSRSNSRATNKSDEEALLYDNNAGILIAGNRSRCNSFRSGLSVDLENDDNEDEGDNDVVDFNLNNSSNGAVDGTDLIGNDYSVESSQSQKEKWQRIISVANGVSKSTHRMASKSLRMLLRLKSASVSDLDREVSSSRRSQDNSSHGGNTFPSMSGRRVLKTAHTFEEIAKSIKNKEVLEKLEKAKAQVEAKKSRKKEVHKATFLVKTKQAITSLMKNAYFFCFSAWLLWLVIGTIFYTLHEDVSVWKGLYMSVSVGYGIFWVNLKSDNISRVFTTLHFTVGIFAIALAMAVFARTLVNAQKNWYMEAMNKKKFEEAQETEGYKDDIIAAVNYYWPKIKAYIFFVLWAFVGVAFCLLTEKWSFVDSLYFSVGAMSTGGFLNIAENSANWEFFFVAIYVIVGVPVMAIACGLLAHQVANYGLTEKLEDKINAQITEDELEMMKLLNIDDGDGSIDGTEFTLLVLVRIGALNPDLISVLYDRFKDLDVNNEGKITYEDLQTRQRSGSSGAFQGMANRQTFHTRLGYGK